MNKTKGEYRDTFMKIKNLSIVGEGDHQGV